MTEDTPHDDDGLTPEKSRRLLAGVFLRVGEIGNYLKTLAADDDHFRPDPDDSGFLMTADPAFTDPDPDALVSLIGLDAITDRLRPGATGSAPPSVIHPDGTKNATFLYMMHEDGRSTDLEVDCETLRMTIVLRRQPGSTLHQIDTAVFCVIPPGTDQYASSALTEIHLTPAHRDTARRYFDLFSRTALNIMARLPDAEKRGYAEARAFAASLRPPGPSGPAP